MASDSFISAKLVMVEAGAISIFITGATGAAFIIGAVIAREGLPAGRANLPPAAAGREPAFAQGPEPGRDPAEREEEGREEEAGREEDEEVLFEKRLFKVILFFPWISGAPPNSPRGACNRNRTHRHINRQAARTEPKVLRVGRADKVVSKTGHNLA
jgi:hypothetical protein